MSAHSQPSPSPALPVHALTPANSDLKTGPLGRVSWDFNEIDATIAIANQAPMNPAYDEYALSADPGKSGIWASQILANWSGDDRDGLSKEYEGSARWTALGNSLPYLQFKVKDLFHTEHLKSARLFWAASGFIRAHRDYIEFARGWTRIHLPLKSNPLCMNSEDAVVYRMRPGEVWFLDGRHPHAGGCFGPEKRVHLVLDFDPAIPIEDLFRDKHVMAAHVEPLYIQRPPLTPEILEKLIEGLALTMRTVSYASVDQLIQLLPFTYSIDTGQTYTILIKVAQRSGDQELLKKALEAEKYFLGE